MNRLVVLRFSDQAKADEAIRALRKLHSESHSERGVKLGASTAVVRDSEGKLSVQEITKEGRGGTAAGAFIGALAGLPAGPLAAAIMATGGALIGNAADLSVQSDFAEFADGIAGKINPGSAVIVAEVDENSVSTFEDLMKGLGGEVLSAQ
jgi:uncharacterized membrane protein